MRLTSDQVEYLARKIVKTLVAGQAGGRFRHPVAEGIAR
jgi:hypothetical protein